MLFARLTRLSYSAGGRPEVGQVGQVGLLSAGLVVL